ncbi:MAG: radical SAM protein [Elusimicrobia bacterium]|nr:radical SAM protein [Elusimicrobiota bacterium]
MTRKGFPFKPQVAGWELTLACNMQCLHCGSSAGRPRPDELAVAEGLDLIDQLADLGARIVTLSGGEPLLHPAWDRYAARLSEKGVETFLITNGLLLGPSIPKIVASGMKRIGISIDGAEKTHDFIRNRPGSLRAALDAARDAKAAGLSVGAVTHVSNANFSELDELHGLLTTVPFDFWQVQLAFRQGRMKEHAGFALDPGRMEAVALSVHRKQRAKGKPWVVAGDNLGYYCAPPITKYPWKGCHAGRHLVGIDADGAVKGCLSLPREFVEGNVRKESLKRIWEDPERFKYNRYFSNDMLKGSCRGCPKGNPCRAGCTVTAVSATGSKFDNPYCLYHLQQAKSEKRN